MKVMASVKLLIQILYPFSQTYSIMSHEESQRGVVSSFSNNNNDAAKHLFLKDIKRVQLYYDKNKFPWHKY